MAQQFNYGIIDVIHTFEGEVTEISDVSRDKIEFKIASDMYLLNINIPKNVISPYCLNKLYDNICTLNRNDYKETLTVQTGSTKSTINLNSAKDTKYYSLGQITFTSGLNDGISRTIKDYTNGSPSVAKLSEPLPYTPSVGDSFNIYAGCDNTKETCQARFNNQTNIRIFPYVPVPEHGI